MLLTVASMNSKDNMLILHETSINLCKLSTDVYSNPALYQITHYSKPLYRYSLLVARHCLLLTVLFTVPLDLMLQLKHSPP